MNDLIPVLVILACVTPFVLCLLAAQYELAEDARRTREFECGWGPHDEHEWVTHPVTKEVVCRLCPMPYYANAPHAHVAATAEGGDAQ